MVGETVTLEGHLIDSDILRKAFARIVEGGGEFEVLEARIGATNEDTSFARLAVKASDPHRLDEILEGLAYLGASANLPAVFNRERLQLRTGSHRCDALQHDWRTLGEDAFEFVVLDQLDWPEDSPDYQPQADLDTLLALWFERSNDPATLYSVPRGWKPAAERLPHD